MEMSAETIAEKCDDFIGYLICLNGTQPYPCLAASFEEPVDEDGQTGLFSQILPVHPDMDPRQNHFRAGLLHQAIELLENVTR